MCKSPLQKSAYLSYVEDEEGGLVAPSPAEALLTDPFYFCMEAGGDITVITDWYESHGITVTAESAEELATPKGEVLLVIYRIREGLL